MSEAQNCEIKISDFSLEVFGDFLSFLYIQEIFVDQKSLEHCFEVMKLGEKYLVSDLVFTYQTALLTKYQQSNWTFDELIEIIKLSERYDQYFLKQAMFKEIISLCNELPVDSDDDEEEDEPQSKKPRLNTSDPETRMMKMNLMDMLLEKLGLDLFKELCMKAITTSSCQ